MKNKYLFDALFIFAAAATLLGFLKFELLPKYIGFSLIPVLVAYQLGKFAQRKFGEK